MFPKESYILENGDPCGDHDYNTLQTCSRVPSTFLQSTFTIGISTILEIIQQDLVICILWQNDRGVDCIVSTHEVLRMWGQKRRFVIHESIYHFIHLMVELSGKIPLLLNIRIPILLNMPLSFLVIIDPLEVTKYCTPFIFGCWYVSPMTIVLHNIIKYVFVLCALRIH